MIARNARVDADGCLRVYLAGPEVFFPDPFREARIKKNACAEYGFEGVFPLDAELRVDHLPPDLRADAIRRANLDLIRSCQLLIANMMPFRGPGMDGGTAFEMGYAAALGMPIFAYSEIPGSYAERVPCERDSDGRLIDADGLLVEDFGLRDNLMMATAPFDFGSRIVSSFRAALAEARKALRTVDGDLSEARSADRILIPT